MKASFVHLPIELLDLIAGHLNTSDFFNVRLACRDFSAKITESSRFQNFYAHKNIELWKSTVDKLEAELRVSSMQRFLEHLTLTGVLLITAGLERSIRDGTEPAKLDDPWSLQYPWKDEDRRSRERLFWVSKTKSQLSDFRKQIDTDEAEREAGLDVIALTQLFQTIATNCKAGGLKSLTLHLVVRREKTMSLSPEVSARHVQFVPRAEQVFSCALQAWDRSGIRIERLNIFSEAKGCAVPTLAFTTLQKNVNLENLGGLQSLSMNLCTRMLEPDGMEKILATDRDAELLPRSEYISQGDAFKEAQKELLKSPENIIGLIAFLKATSNLEHLSIRTYTIRTRHVSFEEHDALRATIFAGLATVPLPSLKSLTLIGAYLSADTLLTLLRNSPLLQSLTLRQVTLKARPGHTWAEIFSHATSPSAHLSFLHINNIFEDMPDETPKIFAFIICFTPGYEPGARVRTGESAAERLRRINLESCWSFELPGPSAHMAFELDRREDVLRGVGYTDRDWGWGPGYRNRDRYPEKNKQSELVNAEGEGDDVFLNRRFPGDWRRPGP